MPGSRRPKSSADNGTYAGFSVGAKESIMRTGSSIAMGIGVLVAAAFALAQMGMGGGMGPGMMGGAHGAPGISVVRHRYAMMSGIPKPYLSARNPLPGTPANIETGRTLYQQNCASCHGATGRGDGPAAASLNPAPSDLEAAVHMPISTDAYLDWTLSEGGAPVGSAMPSFKASLAQEQIWKIVLYLRTL